MTGRADPVVRWGELCWFVFTDFVSVAVSLSVVIWHVALVDA